MGNIRLKSLALAVAGPLAASASSQPLPHSICEIDLGEAYMAASAVGRRLIDNLARWFDIIAGQWHGPAGTDAEHWISERTLRMWGYLGDAVAVAGGDLIVPPAILVMALIDDQSETLVTYEQWTDDGVRVSITAAGHANC